MSREQFDFNDMYSAIDLLDIFELPVYVRKGTWTRDFCFKITSVTDRVRGESYKGGRLYDSDRTYKKSELFYVCEDQDLTFKNDATDEDIEALFLRLLPGSRYSLSYRMLHAQWTGLSTTVEMQDNHFCSLWFSLESKRSDRNCRR